uniref:Putative ovule protein n=1 Tax=Solanum chacoense TaxID=4108 RepID=A0A0V0GMN5_SOLCH
MYLHQPASSKAKVEKQRKKEVEKVDLPYLNLHYLGDCGIFSIVFVEFLSDEINIPSNDFRSDYLRTRYATLL